jgi:pimeloyl-ACP methyl ester carboxylesterase
MKWDKANDTLAVDFRGCKQTGEGTKRGMLQSIARVYDPLGVTSPLENVRRETFVGHSSAKGDSRIMEEMAGWSS